MYITYPISYPASLLLDFLLGPHQKSRFDNDNLKVLINLHTIQSLDTLNLVNTHAKKAHKAIKSDDHLNIHAEQGDHSLGLKDEQANLMKGAIDISTKVVKDIMIPANSVFMINSDERLNQWHLELIMKKGFSRIPVFKSNRGNIIGILRIKQLIGVDLYQNKCITELNIPLTRPIVCYPNTKLMDLLKEFRKGNSHIAVITEDKRELEKKLGVSQESLDELYILDYNIEKYPELMGIVTMEDIIEALTNINILDEDDLERKNANSFTLGI